MSQVCIALNPPEDPLDEDDWTDEEISCWMEDLRAEGFDLEPYRWSGVNDCVSLNAYEDLIPEWVKESARVDRIGSLTRCYWPGASWPC